jgi:hypothetical protein
MDLWSAWAGPVLARQAPKKEEADKIWFNESQK